MDLNWIWETIVIFFVGKLILRIGGRKSISQMTITQTIVMIGIGSLLIQPIAGKKIITTLLVALLLTILMVISEYLEIKFDSVETFFTGKAVIVIEDGKPNIKNLRKLRLTVDRLETRLRQNGVSSIEDIKTATIEVSGQIGYEFKEDKRPITRDDFFTLMSGIVELKELLEVKKQVEMNKVSSSNIFNEVKQRNYEGDQEP
ncbi:MAG TPA: YetF domain-containing protein [Lachnospiraceae bacterium]|nr:YetF domain-containing protein [Lachnospiraceae bacterium]